MMVAVDKNTIIPSKDSRESMLPHFERSLCGCSTRTGTLFIGWFHFIICFIPFVVLIGNAIFGIIEIQESLDTAQNLPSVEISTQLPHAEQLTTVDDKSDEDSGERMTWAIGFSGPKGSMIIYTNEAKESNETESETLDPEDSESLTPPSWIRGWDGPGVRRIIYRPSDDSNYPESQTLGDSRIKRDAINETLDDDLAEIEGDIEAISKEIDAEVKILDGELGDSAQIESDTEAISKEIDGEEKALDRELESVPEESSTNRAVIDTLEKFEKSYRSSMKNQPLTDDNTWLLRIIAELNKIENNNKSSTERVMTGYFGDEFPSLTDEESIADGLDPTWKEMETNIAPLSIFDPRIIDDNQEITINNESSTVKSTEESTDETSAEGDLVSTTSKIENNNESSTKKVMIGSDDGSPSSQSTEEVINDVYPELFNSRGKMEPNPDPLSRKVMEISEDQDMIRPISEDYKSYLLPKIENIDYESTTSKKGNNDDDDFQSSTMSYSNDNNYETSTNVVTDDYETSTNVVNHNYDQESSTNRRFNYYPYYESSTDEVNHKYDHESSTNRRFNYYSYYETSTNGVNHDNDLESSTEIFTSDNGSTSMESSDDDDSSVGDMDVDSSITGFITHFSLAIQKVIVYYYIMVGTLFGIATIFHAILLVGVHYDYTTPILIWLIEQGVLLVLDVSYLITMVFYSANSYAIFGYSLIFGFSLYCLLIVKSYHKTLKKLEKLKSIDAV